MTYLDTVLFEKNKEFLLRLNPNFFSTHDIDISLVEEKAKKAFSIDSEFKYWEQFPDKTIHFQSQIIRDESSLNYVSKQLESVPSSGSITDFINTDVDVHFWGVSLSLRQKLVDLKVDPQSTQTVIGTGGSAIIALGTGSGHLLLDMVKKCNPYAVHVILTDWHDLFSSFFHIDWPLLAEEFKQRGIRHSITCVDSVEKFLWKLRDEGLFYLDHAYVFCSPSTDSKLVEFSRELNGNIVKNWIRYLGYTLDEYNMIVQAADTLQRQPKFYLKPLKSLQGKFVVCGSGPSLDKSLDYLRQLQLNHIIVCGGSSYKALVQAGIRVDFLTLMERDYDIGNDDYAGFHDLIGGAPPSVHLVMAAECYHKMLDTFPNHCAFFRSSLTSANIYANNERQLLPNEGPEAVNAAVSLCIELGAEQVLLVGVDLGSVSPEVTRSNNVLGNSNRIFDQEIEGNFSDCAFTCDSMINVKQVLEVISMGIDATNNSDASSSLCKLYNSSDGIKIKGYNPIHIYDYVDSFCIPATDDIPNLCDISPAVSDWWTSLNIYSRDDFWAQWKSRNPRLSTYQFCREIESLIDSPIPWFPDFLFQMEAAFDLSVSPNKQIPLRIMRGTILKSVLAVTQQLHILRHSKPDVIGEFLIYSKQLLRDTIVKLENQIYQVLDYVESTHEI